MLDNECLVNNLLFIEQNKIFENKNNTFGNYDYSFMNYFNFQNIIQILIIKNQKFVNNIEK